MIDLEDDIINHESRLNDVESVTARAGVSCQLSVVGCQLPSWSWGSGHKKASGIAAMNIFGRCSTIVLVGAAALSGCSQSTPPSGTETKASPSISQIALSYTNFQQITKSVVFVNPELALLCRGASKEEVDAARIRFGPHANTGILIYMNKLAADAFGKSEVAFPVGAVIVKQKTIHGYTDKNGKRVHEKDNGVGGMVKRSPGYDPKYGDWEYFYFEDSAKIESGRISSCVRCHDSARNKDYVFGTWRKTGG